MSESVILESSHLIVDKLSFLENEMKSKIERNDNSVDEIYQMYFDILSLYEKSTILPLDENNKLLLQDKKEDIYLELKLFKIKQDLKKQLDDVHAEIEGLKKSANRLKN